MRGGVVGWWSVVGGAGGACEGVEHFGLRLHDGGTDGADGDRPLMGGGSEMIDHHESAGGGGRQ